MGDRALAGRRILVVEDEYMLAEDIRELLEGDGAEVIGPVARLADALAIVRTDASIDAGVLDINLQGDLVFPLADRLLELSIPFLFTTGYEAEAIPGRFAFTVRCEKPVDARKLRLAVRLAVGA